MATISGPERCNPAQAISPRRKSDTWSQELWGRRFSLILEPLFPILLIKVDFQMLDLHPTIQLVREAFDPLFSDHVASAFVIIYGFASRTWRSLVWPSPVSWASPSFSRHAWIQSIWQNCYPNEIKRKQSMGTYSNWAPAPQAAGIRSPDRPARSSTCPQDHSSGDRAWASSDSRKEEATCREAKRQDH